MDDIAVLVVDDEPTLLDVYETYLGRVFEVVTAADGQAALELVDGTIDVALLDRNMPGMSGAEVLRELRARGYDMPVAMVTGVEPDVDIVDMPFDEYITKPIDGEALVTEVRILANRAEFERSSREFFRVASKVASLSARGDVSPASDDSYRELIDRLSRLQAQLDDTVADILAERPPNVDALEPGTAEIEELLTDINDHTLPPDVRELIDDYQGLRASRPPFMWKWVHRLAPRNTLPCVADAHREAVLDLKTITILFITLLDDILEKHDDRATFHEVARNLHRGQRPDPARPDVDRAYVEFSVRVWETLHDRLREAPRFDAYADLFRFDLKQSITAIEYSVLASAHPEFATVSDLERYESHNMGMFAYADIDLMHSRVAVGDEFATLRDAIWTGQLMARIGNWVSTWERELREGDFSAGPIVYAVEEGVISRGALDRVETDGDAADAVVERLEAHGVDREFLTRWERQYHRLRRYEDEFDSFDLGPFVAGTEEVLRYHLASTGLK
jgi:CheY-like chemotaxis protein